MWDYYQSLPLDQRVDKLVIYFLGVEMLKASGGITREQFPRLHRLLDAYAGILATTCLMPRRVFYYIHGMAWNMESSFVARQVREPQAPLPLSRETEEAFSRAAESAWSLVGGPPSANKSSPGGSSGSSTSWPALLVVTGAGVGAVIYLLHSDNFKSTRRFVGDRWSQLEHSIGMRPRLLQQ
uniref:Uncharacterized protein n=1 Tax=Alexandrium andersonii TaxID=327968 RepID=A0A7S2GGK7_9DINO